jgi:hypothetical protein
MDREQAPDQSNSMHRSNDLGNGTGQAATPPDGGLEEVHNSAMSRSPVETGGGRMSWRRVAFAGVGSAVLTVTIVYVVFHLFGIMAGATTGDVTGGEGAFTATQQVTGWATLIIGLILTFLAALWVVRETVEKPLLQGFWVGLIAAFLIVGPLIGFLGGEIGGLTVATFLLTLGAGVLAGLFGGGGQRRSRR